MDSIKLNEQWAGKPGESQFKGYRKFIKGRMFTLGVEKELAQRKAKALLVAADNLQDGWTDEIVQQALALAVGLVPTRKPAPKLTTGLSLDAAIERCKAALKDDYVLEKKIDGEHYRGSIRRLNSMKLGLAGVHFLDKTEKDGVVTYHFLDMKAVEEATKKGERGEVQRIYMAASKKAHEAAAERLRTINIDSLTEDDLAGAKRYWISRPVTVKTRKPISVTYASNIVHIMAKFFAYAERKLGWKAPPYWKEDMRFARNQKRNMKTLPERSQSNSQKGHMTHDDLKRYYHASFSEFERVLQALAYWCAWTQKELATFRKIELFQDTDGDGEWYIDKGRSKTGEWGKWWIPAPVAKMTLTVIALTTDDPARNPHGLAFLTENDFPLVHDGGRENPDTGKTDYIAGYVWGRIQYLHTTASGRIHSFSWFRKSSAEHIYKITQDRECAKVFMAQNIGDVSEHYLSQKLEESIVASKQLWEQRREIYEQKPLRVMKTYLYEPTKRKSKAEEPETAQIA